MSLQLVVVVTTSDRERERGYIYRSVFLSTPSRPNRPSRIVLAGLGRPSCRLRLVTPERGEIEGDHPWAPASLSPLSSSSEDFGRAFSDRPARHHHHHQVCVFVRLFFRWGIAWSNHKGKKETSFIIIIFFSLSLLSRPATCGKTERDRDAQPATVVCKTWGSSVGTRTRCMHFFFLLQHAWR